MHLYCWVDIGIFSWYRSAALYRLFKSVRKSILVLQNASTSDIVIHRKPLNLNIDFVVMELLLRFFPLSLYISSELKLSSLVATIHSYNLISFMPILFYSTYKCLCISSHYVFNFSRHYINRFHFTLLTTFRNYTFLNKCLLFFIKITKRPWPHRDFSARVRFTQVLLSESERATPVS